MKTSPTKLPKLSQQPINYRSSTEPSDVSQAYSNQYINSIKSVEKPSKRALENSHKLPGLVSPAKKGQTDSGQYPLSDNSIGLYSQKTPEKSSLIPSVAPLKYSNNKAVRQERFSPEQWQLEQNHAHQLPVERASQQTQKPLFTLLDTNDFNQRSLNPKINEQIRSARFRTETDESRMNNQIEALISPRLFKGKLDTIKLSPSYISSTSPDQPHYQHDTNSPSQNFFLELSKDYINKKTKNPEEEGEDISDLYQGLFNKIHSPARYRHMYKIPSIQPFSTKGNYRPKRLLSEPSLMKSKTPPKTLRDHFLARFQINDDERTKFIVQKEFYKIEQQPRPELPKKRFPKMVTMKLPDNESVKADPSNLQSIGPSPKRKMDAFSPRNVAISPQNVAINFKAAEALEKKLQLDNDLNFDLSTFVDANGNEIKLKKNYYHPIDTEQERLYEESKHQLDEALNGMSRRVPSYATKKNPRVKKTRRQLAEALLEALKNIKRMKLTPGEIMRNHVFSTLPFERTGSKLFFEAVKLGNLSLVQTVVERNTKYLVYDFDHVQQTALHWASKLGYEDIANFLIGKNADLNARDMLERTPLYFAIKHEQVELVKMLLLAHCDPWAAKDLHMMELAKSNSAIHAMLRKARQMDLVLKMLDPKERESKWEHEKGNLFLSVSIGSR